MDVYRSNDNSSIDGFILGGLLMAKIKIKNLSTLSDSAALLRCGLYLSGNEYDSQRDSEGNRDIKIRLVETKDGTYSFTVTDFKL